MIGVVVLVLMLVRVVVRHGESACVNTRFGLIRPTLDDMTYYCERVVLSQILISFREKQAPALHAGAKSWLRLSSGRVIWERRTTAA